MHFPVGQFINKRPFLVKNETTSIFVSLKTELMSVLLTETAEFHTSHSPCRRMVVSATFLSRCGCLRLERGFYFLLVTCGTASVSGFQEVHSLSCGHLGVLTPSLQASLYAPSSDFSAICLYISPDYFDSQPAGQLVYSQVSRFTGNCRLPLFRLCPDQATALQQTLELFSTRLDAMQLYGEGALRHLCGFLLLQVADMLSGCSESPSVYLKHSHEIFRNFKKLLVDHYRTCHTVEFYAARLHITSAYLSRIVRQTTGRTVCFHISELLCADARKMLECTDLSVKEIAEILGFSDQSVFGKFFLRRTGFSPLRYRTRSHRLRSGRSDSFPDDN